MQATYLLLGSYAYDTILLHQGEFHARILPEALSRLNVAFGVNEVNNEFGGCAGNIAYNAALLGDKPLLVGALGSDGQPYIERLRACGLNPDTLTVDAQKATAHAWILTDVQNNQITGFSAGAMHNVPVLPAKTPDIWHIAPAGAEAMATLAKQAHLQGKQFYFDPGQAVPSFVEGQVEHIFPLAELLNAAQGLFVNEYEAELLERCVGRPLAELITRPDQFIVRTKGSKGAELLTQGDSQHFPVAPTRAVVDPTGCGDAFRAGFMHGKTQGWSLSQCVELGAVMGSFAVECTGGQKHNPSYAEIQERLATFVAKEEAVL